MITIRIIENNDFYEPHHNRLRKGAIMDEKKPALKQRMNT